MNWSSSTLTVCLLGAVTFVSAQEEIVFSQAGDWQILRASSVKNECYMQRNFENGTVVRVGLFAETGNGFFSAMSREWTHIHENAEAEVFFDFGSDLFSGIVKSFEEDGYLGGYAFFNNPEFVAALSAKTSLRIDGRRNFPIHVDLKGTSRAIRDVQRCLKESDG